MTDQVQLAVVTGVVTVLLALISRWPRSTGRMSEVQTALTDAAVDGVRNGR